MPHNLSHAPLARKQEEVQPGTPLSPDSGASQVLSYEASRRRRVTDVTPTDHPIPTRLRAHLLAAERGATLPPRPLSATVDAQLPGHDDTTPVLVLYSDWLAYGDPVRDPDYEPAHVEVEAAYVGGVRLVLDEDTREPVHEALCEWLDRCEGRT